MSEEEKINQEADASQSATENESVNIKSGIEPETPDQTSAINTPEIKNMEVHHHPDLHHKKKNSKEYFLEFLMIFLAVTMGFFAENIREYFSNNEIVIQLTQQMVQELKKDTASLNQSILDQTDLRKKADSVFYMLKKRLDQIDVKKLQHLNRGLFSNYCFCTLIRSAHFD